MVLTGFVAGIGGYKAVLEIAHLSVVPADSDIKSLALEVERLNTQGSVLLQENEMSKAANSELRRRIGELEGELAKATISAPAPPAEPPRVVTTSAAAVRPALPLPAPGMSRVSLRDGTMDEYDRVLYGTKKPPSMDFDLYTQLTEAGLDGQRTFPLKNIRFITFGEPVAAGRYRSRAFIANIELRNGVKVSGWQYGARSFYLISSSLPEPTRQGLDLVLRVEFPR
jgi:hypothetical protein